MTNSKSLPARPSLQSLRKQAKKLARENALSQREAQLALARDYGYSGWQALLAEVHDRLGQGLEWAVIRARQLIHDNDVAGLQQLLSLYPALLSWQADAENTGLVGMATQSFSDSGNADSEQHFTRASCAELLINAGAIVTPAVCDSLVESRAKGLLQLFQRKGLLPRTLKFLVALDALDAVRATLDTGGDTVAVIHEAFLCACRWQHQQCASLLLDAAITRDPALGRQIDAGPGRVALIDFLIKERLLDFMHATPSGPWQAFCMHQAVQAIHDGDVAALVLLLQREASLLGETCVGFQVGMIERATLRNKGECITALVELKPALLTHSPRPRSQAIEFALSYVKPRLIPVLTRIWPLPDDLPHAAGVGDIERVRRWFGPTGHPELGDLARHFPANDDYARGNLQWGIPALQQVLDTALAWSVLNRHFEVADFLLQHGADINTRWSTHEPASILHELVFHANYESMQFLIDRGIDMGIRDHRWHATAQGWAFHAAKDEAMAEWLAAAERRRLDPAS